MFAHIAIDVKFNGEKSLFEFVSVDIFGLHPVPRYLSDFQKQTSKNICFIHILTSTPGKASPHTNEGDAKPFVLLGFFLFLISNFEA